MPCHDDRNSYDYSERERADKMTRIACRVMTALEELGKEDFLLLKDDEIRQWWAEHKEFDRLRRAHEEETQRLIKEKAEAMSKLTEEQKRILGLK
jgi:hypothetical protein